MIVRMYDVNFSTIRDFIDDPSQSHLKVLNVDKTDKGYIFELEVPEIFAMEFSWYNSPIIHPIVIFDRETQYSRIACFKLIDRFHLQMANVYDGINFDET